MKKITAIATAFLVFGSTAFAQETVYTKGSVKALDMPAGKVTIIHEELV